MTDDRVPTLEDLVAAHLDGGHPAVPDQLQTEFAHAIAAHAVLNGLIHETETRIANEHSDRSPPDLSEEFQIEREIGRGGMGVVYLVHQRSLNRQVALKVLRPGEQTFGPLVKRFLREARHLARLRHPNIVSIHEVGDAQGEPYFTMDFIDGDPLSAEIARGPMPPTHALAIFKQVATGVQHAHRQGIIHRDLKPSNVLIDREGNALVTDFGLARDVSQSSNLTQTGELLGTPQYMAPEQARGQASLIGEATDIHALGLVLFEMLAGRAAFISSSPADVLVRLLNEEPPRLRSLDRRIPRDLETICQKMLQKAPAARYANVTALLEDIRRYESGEPLVARRAGAVMRAFRWSQRHWKLAPAVAATATLMLMVTLVIGPRLFDKTSEELIGWAEELHLDGRHEEAVRVYRRALDKAEPAQRSEILNLMIRCCGEIGDAKGLVAAALPILKDAPAASFGKYDYLVAQAVYADAIAEHSNLTASVASRSEEDYALLEFLANRYEVFLNGPHGSQREREQAAGKLLEIQTFLDAKNESGKHADLESTVRVLPQGTPDELLELAKDFSTSRWQRGKAAYAAGILLDEQADREAARQAFHDAFELMRSVFPTYAGVSTRIRSSNAHGVQPIESEECGLLRDVFAAVKRFDPEVADALQGGLRFRIEGVSLPSEVVPKLRVELYDQSLGASKLPDESLPRHIPIQDQAAFLGVADGRYRVAIRSAGVSSYGNAVGHLGSLLDLDLSNLPHEVEIQGNTLEYVIPAWLASEITLLEPTVNTTVDLRTEFFHWSPIQGADHYYLNFVKLDSRIGEGSYYKGGATIRVASNIVCLSTLPESERKKADWLKSGATAVWNVQAFDAQERRIGASVQADRNFLVGCGLLGE